jgi:hypothetical protein
LRNAPVVINQVDIAVADTAMADFNLHLPRGQSGSCIAKGFKRSLGFLCGVAIDVHNNVLLFLD